MVLADRVRFPVPLFDDKKHCGIFISSKDTESHEDSDFCYDWGVNYDKLLVLWNANT